MKSPNSKLSDGLCKKNSLYGLREETRAEKTLQKAYNS